MDFEELTLHIKQAKGQKDRISVMPESLLDSLKNTVAGKEKNDPVFASERGGKLTTRTLQKIFENALKASGVLKNASFHSFLALLPWRGKACWTQDKFNFAMQN